VRNLGLRRKDRVVEQAEPREGFAFHGIGARNLR
jgi:hypothetical protein